MKKTENIELDRMNFSVFIKCLPTQFYSKEVLATYHKLHAMLSYLKESFVLSSANLSR